MAAVFSTVTPTVADTDWETSAFKGWTVTTVEITGLDEGLMKELRGGLALAYTRGFLGKKRAVFYPETLDKDIQRSLLFLARRGYPHARVTPLLQAKPHKEQVTVVLQVDPGPPVIVAGTSAQGLPSGLTGWSGEFRELTPGGVFTDAGLDRAIHSLDSLLAESGYARATVEPLVDWEDSTRVRVLLVADPGPVCYFGDVIVSGADDDVLPLTRKSANIHRGTRYSPQTVHDAQQNLRILDLFRQVRLDIQEGSSPDTLDIWISLGMREFRTVDVTGRYWSDDGLSGSARWTHRNRFKRGRGSSLTLFASGPSQLLKYSVWWPAVLWARSRAIGTVGGERESEEAYEVVEYGGQLSLRYDIALRTRLWVAGSVSNVNIINRSADVPDLDREEGLLTTLSFGGQRDAGNDPILPTRGTVGRFNIEWAPPGSVSDNHYIKGEVTGILYVPVLGPTSLATRATVGLAQPTSGSTSILPNRRFYSGGSNSMRGFERRKLGPLDSNEAPLGGEAKLELAAEYRFPLPWRFGGTLFVDSGQVWPTIDDITSDNIEVAAGTGLWLNTIVGPIRGDVAYRLTNHEPSQPRWVFHFSVGPAF